MASHKRVGSLSGFWDLFTKLHKSSWMSDVLSSAPRLFLKCGLPHRQVLGQRIQFQRSIVCAESLAVHTETLQLPASDRSDSDLLQGIVDR